MEQRSLKSGICIVKTIFQISMLWLLGILWWGLITLSPMQTHNQIILRDIPLICIGLILSFSPGFFDYSWIFTLFRKKDPTFRNLSEGDNQKKPYPKNLKDCAHAASNCSQYENQGSPPHDKKLMWSLLLLLLIGINSLSIFYFRLITISFLLTSLCILVLGKLTGLHSYSQGGFLLFVSSLGFGITRIIMNVLRGRPGTGARFFALQISFLLNLFGKHTDAISGTLLYHGKKITCDLLKTGFYPWIAFTLLFSIYILVKRGRWERKIPVLIIGLFLHYLYLLARFSLLTYFIPPMMPAGTFPFNLFYWRGILISYLPLLPLWFFILYESRLSESAGDFFCRFSPLQFRKNDRWLWGVSLLIISFLILSLLFPWFPSPSKKSHIIIDEIHSNWESSLIEFNQSSRGILAENSYFSFLNYLRHYVPVTILTNKTEMTSSLEGVETTHTPTITPSLLKTLHDQHPTAQPILILKCITSPFDKEEIDAIKNFVSEGGCVFLIGDHTDVFFMNKNLNELATHFGIRYEQNSVYFIDGGWVITRPEHYKNHPATASMNEFIWATGDSLKLSPPAFPLIYSSHVCFADEVNYFLENFFGNKTIDAEELFGSFCLMAGAEYGKGKVAAFTDSTCFNNYLMFTVGRRELITGIFKWFGGEIAPIRKLPPKVILDARHGPGHCMSFGNSEWFLSPASYDNLIFSIGRLGIFSEILYNKRITKKGLKDTDCLIIASPTKDFSNEEKKVIKEYIDDGGSLFLIEGAHSASTINQIAHLFDLHIHPIQGENIHDRPIDFSNLSASEGYSINPTAIDGGEVLFKNERMSILCVKYYGKGLVLALGDDGIFMKINFQNFENELTTFQCDMFNALLHKDKDALKSIGSRYLKKIYP